MREQHSSNSSKNSNSSKRGVGRSSWRVPLGILGFASLAAFSLLIMSESGSLTRSSSLRTDEVTWDHDVMHIVVTRFMQDQPHLLALARARFQLFTTVCFPTMVQQSSQDFLWIIQTDPQLDKEMRHDLAQLLKPYPHFFLVGSNLQQQQGQGGSFRTVAKELLQSPIYSGDVKLLRQAYLCRNNTPLLQTRLDADDGLNVEYLHQIQRQATRLFHQESVQWYYWCIKRHFEWYSESNDLHPVEHSRLCVTPGLTVGFATEPFNTVVSSEPPPLDIAHDVLYKEIEKKMAAVPKPKKQKMGELLKINPTPCGGLQCIRMVDDLSVGAIRSRTWTSAGMMDIFGATITDSADAAKKQSQMWQLLTAQFGVAPTAFQDVQVYLKEHIIEIARDNLDGQCTQGHSCKIKSVETLQRLIDVDREGQKGGKGVEATADRL